jgi:hypothetical protein
MSFNPIRPRRRVSQLAVGLVAPSLILTVGLIAHSSAGRSAAPPKKPAQIQIPATLEDFFEPGTQENTLNTPLLAPFQCSYCHEFDEYDGNRREIVPPSDNWRMSLMAQAARDPVWHAALAIANQDVAFAGDTCIRCHSPNAWLGGRSVPTDGSAFVGSDWDGVSCNFCHRLVDPVPNPSNPPEDTPILDALASQGLLPAAPGNARYVVDPDDVRRGPLDDVPANYHGVPIIVSPFHSNSNLCGMCHDVSNALFTRQANGTYALNALDAPHPTGNPHHMMPEQRTFSEWRNSTFATTGVYFADHRFGGDHPTGVMKSCQDCHMPKHYGGVCGFWESDPFFPRPDVAEHAFIGANTWVLGAVYDQYGQSETYLTEDLIDVNHARTQNMLRAASDMQLVQLVNQSGNQLKVRVINYSGHKLPTGYPEGRRMWLNVQFLNGSGDVIAQRGAYDFATATLNTSDTKVYEMRLGMDRAIARTTGLLAGESFHLVLNNMVLKDNRIPPIGFNNANFQAVLAAPVGHTYADGQYWDDTLFAIPNGAAGAIVTLYYQTTSREYIEFLRDANTAPAPNAGTNAYERWAARGKSAPLDMDVVAISLAPPRAGDVNRDGTVNIDDLFAVILAWGPCPPPNLCPADVDGNGFINVDDLFAVIMNWG